MDGKDGLGPDAMTGYSHPPGSDFPQVTATAEQLERAMVYIDRTRPAEFGPIIKRSGLLTAGAAKLINDQMGGSRGAFVGFGPIMAAMVRVAASRPDIGRDGLGASLQDLSELAVMMAKEPRKGEMRGQMQAMAAMSLVAFDLLRGVGR